MIKNTYRSKKWIILGLSALTLLGLGSVANSNHIASANSNTNIIKQNQKLNRAVIKQNAKYTKIHKIGDATPIKQVKINYWDNDNQISSKTINAKDFKNADLYNNVPKGYVNYGEGCFLPDKTIDNGTENIDISVNREQKNLKTVKIVYVNSKDKQISDKTFNWHPNFNYYQSEKQNLPNGYSIDGMDTDVYGNTMQITMVLDGNSASPSNQSTDTFNYVDQNSKTLYSLKVSGNTNSNVSSKVINTNLPPTSAFVNSLPNYKYDGQTHTIRVVNPKGQTPRLPVVPKDMNLVGNTVNDTVNFVSNNQVIGKDTIKGITGSKINLNALPVPNNYKIAKNQMASFNGSTHNIQLVPSFIPNGNHNSNNGSSNSDSSLIDVNNIDKIPDGHDGMINGKEVSNITSQFEQQNNLYYVINSKGMQLHKDMFKIGKSDKDAVHVKSNSGFTGKVLKVFKYNGAVRLEVVDEGQEHYGQVFFMTDKPDFVQNAYLQNSNFNAHHQGKDVKYITVRAKRDAGLYDGFKYSKQSLDHYIKKGKTAKVIEIKTINKNHLTRMVLDSGLILTANKNFVQIV